MKLNYDNLEDARSKLNGTYCLYGGKAIVVKSVSQEDEINPLNFSCIGSNMASGRAFPFAMSDPKFNCSNYNIGYLNQRGSAAWFYRLPMKQYRQGLRHDQVQMRASGPFHGWHPEFKSGKSLADMMEGIYPNLEYIQEYLKAQEANNIAFHRNFALSMDAIHGDFILEYKGTKIGYSHDLENFKFGPAFEHLNEYLHESLKGAAA